MGYKQVCSLVVATKNYTKICFLCKIAKVPSYMRVVSQICMNHSSLVVRVKQLFFLRNVEFNRQVPFFLEIERSVPRSLQDFCYSYGVKCICG